MNLSVAYNHLIGVSDAPVGSGSGGGDVEDVMRRLDRVETSVVDLRTEVGGLREEVGNLRTEVAVITTQIPYLATAASVAELKTEMVKSISELRSEMTKGFSQLRSEMTEGFSQLRSEMAASVSELKSENKSIAATIPHLATAASVAAAETRIIKWFLGTAASLTALVSTLAFTIAKFVH